MSDEQDLMHFEPTDAPRDTPEEVAAANAVDTFDLPEPPAGTTYEVLDYEAMSVLVTGPDGQSVVRATDLPGWDETAGG